MYRVLRIMLSALLPAVVIGAASPAAARKPFPVLRKLVKAGILEKADLDGLKNLRKEFKACKRAVKEGKQAKGSCVGKRIEQVKAQIALFEKVLTKIEKKRLKRRAGRALRKLQRRLKKLEAKASAAAPAEAPKPAPAETK
jgi:hypothetical protein